MERQRVTHVDFLDSALAAEILRGDERDRTHVNRERTLTFVGNFIAGRVYDADGNLQQLERAEPREDFSFLLGDEFDAFVCDNRQIRSAIRASGSEQVCLVNGNAVLLDKKVDAALVEFNASFLEAVRERNIADKATQLYVEASSSDPNYGSIEKCLRELTFTEHLPADVVDEVERRLSSQSLDDLIDRVETMTQIKHEDYSDPVHAGRLNYELIETVAIVEMIKRRAVNEMDKYAEKTSIAG